MRWTGWLEKRNQTDRLPVRPARSVTRRWQEYGWRRAGVEAFPQSPGGSSGPRPEKSPLGTCRISVSTATRRLRICRISISTATRRLRGEGGLKGRKRSLALGHRTLHVKGPSLSPRQRTLNRRVARQGRTLGISLNRRVARQGRTLGISSSVRPFGGLPPSPQSPGGSSGPTPEISLSRRVALRGRHPKYPQRGKASGPFFPQRYAAMFGLRMEPGRLQPRPSRGATQRYSECGRRRAGVEAFPRWGRWPERPEEVPAMLGPHTSHVTDSGLLPRLYEDLFRLAL